LGAAENRYWGWHKTIRRDWYLPHPHKKSNGLVIRNKEQLKDGNIRGIRKRVPGNGLSPETRYGE